MSEPTEAPATNSGSGPEPPAAPSGAPASPSQSGGATNPDGTPRPRRRRGSRGGRNRRKPSTGDGTQSGAVALESTNAPGLKGDDYSDAQADRGLTDDDVGAQAKDDAGLTKPRIGDSRPAPRVGDTRRAPEKTDDGDKTGAPKRRRRRGGRGRGGQGGQGGDGQRGGGAKRDEVVRSELGADDGLVLDELDERLLDKRRGTTRKGRPAGRYFMCVHVRQNKEVHIATMEGRSLVEHYVNSPDTAGLSIDGNIYLGRVQNVLPGMEAAFLDFGTPKNGVLYRGDVSFDKDEVEEREPKIEKLLKNGQSIMVQVTKNPIGAKGARLSQEVSLAGRFVVLVPSEPKTYGISKRLPDDERKRLRRILDKVRPDDAGLIVRTAAEGASADELERDVKRLKSQWQQISDLAARSKAPKLLYQEPDMVMRIVREEFTKEYRGIVIDDRELYDEVKGYVDAVAPELSDRVEYYDAANESMHVFERFHVAEQLHKALDRKVWLPSGGSLIIERTEALTVIDVNTGKNVGKSSLEETVYANNLEAAEEVARQLRLRDIGGIIVIDFIDMEPKANRDGVLKAFKNALARDKTRTQVFEISELGLIQMTRKRISEGLVEAFSDICPECKGRGFLVDQSFLDEMN